MALLIADFSFSGLTELKERNFERRWEQIASTLELPVEQTYISLIYPQPGLPELVAKPGLPASILAYPPHKEPLPLPALASDWSQLPTNPLTYSVGPGSNFNRVGEALLELAGLAYDEERGWRDRGSVVIVPPKDSCLATFLGHAISHYLQSGLLSAPLYLCRLAVPCANATTAGTVRLSEVTNEQAETDQVEFELYEWD